MSQTVTIIIKNDNIMQNSLFGVYTLHSTGILNASGIHITNIDLNNLTTQGTYYTVNNAETSTLSNLPMKDQSDISGRPLSYGRCKIINISMDMSNQIFYQYFITPRF